VVWPFSLVLMQCILTNKLIKFIKNRNGIKFHDNFFLFPILQFIFDILYSPFSTHSLLPSTLIFPLSFFTILSLKKDMIENVFLTIAINTFPERNSTFETCVLISGYFTSLKWFSLYVNIFVTVVIGVIALYYLLTTVCIIYSILLLSFLIIIQDGKKDKQYIRNINCLCTCLFQILHIIIFYINQKAQY
jgi:hypothetical protein